MLLEEMIERPRFQQRRTECSSSGEIRQTILPPPLGSFHLRAHRGGDPSPRGQMIQNHPMAGRVHPHESQYNRTSDVLTILANSPLRLVRLIA
ncbi:hypothetical protein FEAC_07760 [Ferrimicrobium acidiphilum DSM 19497]|uniref:Uncharacterized protein n=1 Tax=Ferrimicrobium acidiphilum DSM 19497 TaxID=1121877 RepID=A0A0D8FYE9_9ACTN|nr:hypothetical protein FEAC_07760 [Ferrimicrobium acidiphilum DSM 19497]